LSASTRLPSAAAGCLLAGLFGSGCLPHGHAIWGDSPRLGERVPLHQLVEFVGDGSSVDPSCAGGGARVFADATVSWWPAEESALDTRVALLPRSRCTDKQPDYSVAVTGGSVVMWDRGEWGGQAYFEHASGACQPIDFPWGHYVYEDEIQAHHFERYLALRARQVSVGRGDAWVLAGPVGTLTAPDVLWHVSGTEDGFVATPVALADGRPLPEGEPRSPSPSHWPWPVAHAASPSRPGTLWLDFGSVIRELHADGQLSDLIHLVHPWAARFRPVWGARLDAGAMLFSYDGAVLRLDPDGDTWRETWLLPPWCVT
jgi:hypothetical protein